MIRLDHRARLVVIHDNRPEILHRYVEQEAPRCRSFRRRTGFPSVLNSSSTQLLACFAPAAGRPGTARHLPQSLDALGGGEQRVVAAHRVQDQPLVGLEHVADQAGVVHGELQPQLVQPHAGARPLAVERQRHLGRVGEVEREVVGPLGAPTPEPGGNMHLGGSGVGAQGPDHLTFDLADASEIVSVYGKRPGPGMRLDKLSLQFAMHDTRLLGEVFFFFFFFFFFPLLRSVTYFVLSPALATASIPVIAVHPPAKARKTIKMVKKDKRISLSWRGVSMLIPATA